MVHSFYLLPVMHVPNVLLNSYTVLFVRVIELTGDSPKPTYNLPKFTTSPSAAFAVSAAFTAASAVLINHHGFLKIIAASV